MPGAACALAQQAFGVLLQHRIQRDVGVRYRQAQEGGIEFGAVGRRPETRTAAEYPFVFPGPGVEGVAEGDLRHRQRSARQPAAEGLDAGEDALHQVAAGVWVMADPFVARRCAVDRHVRAPEVVGQRLVAHGLFQRLADVAAGQQHQAVHAVGAELHALAHVQAEVGIARQFGAGVEQADVVGGGERVGQRFRYRRQALGRQAGGARQCVGRDVARAGGIEQRLQVGPGHPLRGHWRDRTRLCHKGAIRRLASRLRCADVERV